MLERHNACNRCVKRNLCQAQMIASGASTPRTPSGHHKWMPSNQDIGRAINLLRDRRGMSKKDLAIAADEMDPGNLNRIISGSQEATTQRINSIAKALGVRVSDIYRIAEGGSVADVDPRKEALHSLIDSLDSSQLSAVFRQYPNESKQRETDPEKKPAKARLNS